MARASAVAFVTATAVFVSFAWASLALAADRDAVGTNDLPDSSQGVGVSCIDVQSGLPFDYQAQRVMLSGSIDHAWRPDTARVCLGSLGGLRQRLVSDGTGGGYAGWADSRLGEPHIYAQHFTSEGVIAEGWPDGGRPICASSHSQYHLDVASDGAGGAYFVWEDYRQGAGGDIYLQRITASGDAANGWPAEGLSISSAGGEQSLPRVARDPEGGAYIVWQDRRSGALQIYIQRVTSSGTLAAGWPDGGEPLSGAAPVALAPAILSDSSGAGVVIWRHQSDAGTWDLLATLLPPLASTAGVTPLALSNAADALGDCAVVLSDPHSGFVAWSESRSTTPSMRVQSVDFGSGLSAGWASGGVIACSSPQGGSAPALAPDGAGGVVVAWEDFRHGEGDIYGQRISAQGAISPNWPNSGLVIAAAAGDQYAPVLARDSVNAVIATWSDAVLGTSGRFLGSIPFAWGSPPVLVSAVALPGHVRIVWQMGGPEKPHFAAYRRLVSDEWNELKVVTPGDSGKLVLDDRTVPDGCHVEYRLGLMTADASYSFQIVALDVPRAPTVLTLHFAKALGSEHSILVSFALPRGVAPLLELIDVSGRRLASQRMNGLEPGEQVVRFALPSRTPSGVYFMRLVQGGTNRVAKVVMIR